MPLIFIAVGLCLLGYPWISEYLFENRVDSIIKTYEAEAGETSEEDVKAMLEKAELYNSQLSQAQVVLTDPFTETQTADGELDYDSVLSLNTAGLMGMIEIPNISVYLPIYHGTSSEVLEQGIGHLKGSSLPVGGKGTHAVLSGHTGLNSAKLFTDLTELAEGDLFFIHILNNTLAYKVCDSSIVLPEDTSKLLIRDQEDLITLVTCTPYGVNSHRLLVTGKRTDYVEKVYEEIVEKGSMATDSLWMKSYRKAVMIGLAVVMGFALIILVWGRTGRRKVSSDRRN